MAVPLETLVKQLGDSGIIAQSKLEPYIPPQANPKDGEQLLRELYKQGLLTKFQAQQFAAGKVKSLVLGGYTVLDRIGAGGMGQVFKAEHRRMKRLVAIKTLPAAMMKDAATQARFQREVEAAAKLLHPNIVSAFDADEANGVHFLVMEYVAGHDLSALVKKNGPFSVSRAVNYILQAAKGLEFAHKRGVVHRDIKPANLLLDSEGTVKILDMGLARIDGDGNAATQAELTSSGMVMGTVDYMAPEQGLNTKTADARADIYSLGCSLYYLISGKATYEGDTMAAKLLAHHTQPIPDLSTVQADVPKQLQDVFNKMVAKKIEDRYQTMTEVIAALERLGGNSNTANDPIGVTVTLNKVSSAAPQNINVSANTTKTSATKQVAATKPSGGKQPPWKNTKVLVGAGAVGLAVLLGVILIVRDKDGKEVARIDATDGTKVTLPAGGSVEVQQSGTTTMPKTTSTRSNTLFMHDPAFPQWMKRVQAMPPEDQVKAVVKKLQELNPGYDGNESHQIENNVVAMLHVDGVRDISPVRALAQLTKLTSYGVLRPGASSKISDLSSLQGMKLTKLAVRYNDFSDLSPLRGMPLQEIDLQGTKAFDLSPLRGMPLQWVNLNGFVSDLSPLESKTLKRVEGGYSPPITKAHVAALQKLLPDCKFLVVDRGQTSPSPTANTPPLAVAPFDAAQAKAHQQAWAKHLGVEVETPNSVGMKMVLIPPGEFLMGSTDEQVAEAFAALKAHDERMGDEGTKDRIQKGERPQHKVLITKPFQLSATEVTVEQFKKFVAATKHVTEAEKTIPGEAPTHTYLNPAYTVDDDQPVGHISWNDATAYCQWLSSQERRTYRLPTEAEWEYACRAGTVTHFSFGDNYDDLPKYGWIGKNSLRRSPHPVGTLLPNPFGLYDMHGNLYEWCTDWTGEYQVSPSDDPTGPKEGRFRVARGGDYWWYPFHCRSATRSHGFAYTPDKDLNSQNYGFRCVAELEIPNTVSVTPTSSSKLFMHSPDFPQWVKDVQAMPAEQQIEAVSKKLMELNPGFDGKVTGGDGKGTPKIENSVVSEIRFSANQVTDLSPLRAFSGLKVVTCTGDASSGRAMLEDLTPLRGMQISKLLCSKTKVTDLTPLVGMKLQALEIHSSQVADISPLRDMPLSLLNCGNTGVTDFSPLLDMKTLLDLRMRKVKVTPAQVAALQKALPNCKIEWDDPSKQATPAK